MTEQQKLLDSAMQLIRDREMRAARAVRDYFRQSVTPIADANAMDDAALERIIGIRKGEEVSGSADAGTTHGQADEVIGGERSTRSRTGEAAEPPRLYPSWREAHAAARREAFEEAAKIADAKAQWLSKQTLDGTPETYLEDLAAAIRAAGADENGK